MTSVITHNAEETRGLGAFIGQRLKGGAVVTLDAPLGLGKTTLAQGLVAGATGLAQRHVTSPAFSLVNEYAGRDGGLAVYHMDLYRLDDLAFHDEEMLGEYLADGQAVSVIEWGERFVRRLAPGFLEIRLEFGDSEPNDVRRIELNGHGDADFSELLLSLEGYAASSP